MSADCQRVTLSEVVNIGRDLKRELQAAAREDHQADVTWLVRRLCRQYLEERAMPSTLPSRVLDP